MKPIRVLVVDDEPLARRRVLRLLEQEEGVEVVGECANGRDAADALVRDDPDLVFLDVQMPELDGFGVLEEVGPERMPLVVFVTAYDQYALQAFEVHALDYLLKPFDEQRFHQAFRRARVQLERRESTTQRRSLLSLLEQLGTEQRQLERLLTGAEGRYLERLMVKVGGRVIFLRAGEIDWVEAEGNYVRLHAGKQGYLVRETMSALEQRLDPRQFVRVHRSTIVNLDQVRELRPWFAGDYLIVLKDATELRLSRGYRAKLEERLS
jgi:two-component system, LytTR family, response regulator